MEGKQRRLESKQTGRPRFSSYLVYTTGSNAGGCAAHTPVDFPGRFHLDGYRIAARKDWQWSWAAEWHSPAEPIPLDAAEVDRIRRDLGREPLSLVGARGIEPLGGPIGSEPGTQEWCPGRSDPYAIVIDGVIANSVIDPQHNCCREGNLSASAVIQSPTSPLCPGP